MEKVKMWARTLKRQIMMLYFAVRDPRLPWHVKVLAGMVVGYALSPIDLIPDFIPVLGYLDDVILLPAGIWLALKLIPDAIRADAVLKAEQAAGKPVSKTGAAVIVLLWVLAAAWAGYFFLK